MLHQGLAHLKAHAVQGVQAGSTPLGHIGDDAAPDFPKPLLPGGKQILSVQPGAAGDQRASRQQL